MTIDNRIMNGIENDLTSDAQGNNEISMQAELLHDKVWLDEIHHEADMREAFARIREETAIAVSSAELRLLYRYGADLIELLDMVPFQERVGERLDDIRRAAEEEFARAAHALNRRGAEIGVKADFSEKWLGKASERPGVVAYQDV